MASQPGDTSEDIWKSPQIFWQVVEQLADHALLMMDAQGNFCSWNGSVERMLGYSREEFVGRPSTLIFTPEDIARGEAERELASARQSGRAGDHRWHLRKGGQRFWAEGEVTSVRSDSGETLGFVKVLRDATEKKLAQERLQQAHEQAERLVEERTLELSASESRFRTLVESMEEVVFTLDPEGCITGLFGGGLRSLGIDAADWQGRHAWEVLAPTKLTDYPGKVRQALEGESLVYEICLPRFGDKCFLHTLSPLKDDEDRIIGVVGTLRDISPIKELEKQVVEAGEWERQRIGQDLHDGLGQLLTGMTLLSKVLEGKLQGLVPEETQALQAELTRLAKSAGEQSRVLARSLYPVELERNGFREAVEKMAAGLEQSTGTRVQLELQALPQLENIEIAAQVFRILQEALHNAIKHGEARHVTVELYQQDNNVFAMVKNDGKPITRGVQRPGGMGMRTMRYRASMLGGTIHISSDTDTGTVLLLTFPASAGGRALA